jgi:hypothetical protein
LEKYSVAGALIRPLEHGSRPTETY